MPPGRGSRHVQSTGGPWNNLALPLLRAGGQWGAGWGAGGGVQVVSGALGIAPCDRFCFPGIQSRMWEEALRGWAAGSGAKTEMLTLTSLVPKPLPFDPGSVGGPLGGAE